MRPFLRDYGLHGLLILVLALTAIRAWLVYPTRDELEAGIASKDPRVQVRALHLKAGRRGTSFSQEDIVRMLGSEEPLVRELAMIPMMMRFAPGALRDGETGKLEEREERRRARFLSNHRIGNFDERTLARFREFLEGRAEASDQGGG